MSQRKRQKLRRNIMKEPFDVFDVGRMAVVRIRLEPSSRFGRQKSTKAPEFTTDQTPLCWNELGTNDTPKAGDFYVNLFGWTKEEFSDASRIHMFKNGDRSAGGMYKITPEMGPIPPIGWSISRLTTATPQVKKPLSWAAV